MKNWLRAIRNIVVYPILVGAFVFVPAWFWLPWIWVLMGALLIFLVGVAVAEHKVFLDRRDNDD